MNVAQLMSRNVEFCRPEDTLADAAAKMWNGDIGCLPVVGGDERVVGIVTDRDLCMAAYTQGRPMQEVPVSVAMSRALYTCQPEDALIEAEETMRSNQVRRLPVLDAEGNLVGIISLADLSREADRESGRKGRQVTGQEVNATLAAVATPRNGASLTRAS
jgi:CBS-domain-containing membrane protein